MADAELIAETNRLLRTILENDAESRAKSKETRDQMNARLEESKTRREARMQERLRAQGLPEEATKGTEEEWDDRQKVAQRRAKEKAEASRERFEQYQNELLAELRLQSDLLRQIAERLAA